MKKTLLVLLITVMAIGFVFAEAKVDEHKALTKVEFGADFGYEMQLKMYSFDAVVKAEFMPFKNFKFCTVDGVVKIGALTDFHELTVFNGFAGVGATKYFNKFNAYINLGADAIVTKEIKMIGLATNVGCEYTFENKMSMLANLKMTDFIKEKLVMYEPSLGIRYTY